AAQAARWCNLVPWCCPKDGWRVLAYPTPSFEVGNLGQRRSGRQCCSKGSTTLRSSRTSLIEPCSSTPRCWALRSKTHDRIERSGLGVPIDLVYLDLGGTVVELISYDGASVDPAPKNEHLGYRMIALEVDDMQKTTDYLSTRGVEVVWGPRVRETYSRAEICDPNGYRIELGQWFTSADHRVQGVGSVLDHCGRN